MIQNLRQILLTLTILLSMSITLKAQGFTQFTDESLQSLLNSSEIHQTSGVIWIWSPRMNLSIYGLSELKPIAALLDLELTVLVDPHHPELSLYDSRYALLFKESYIMNSQTLEKFGALLHFPVLILYKNGKILLPNRPGYDEPERLYRYLARRLL